MYATPENDSQIVLREEVLMKDDCTFWEWLRIKLFEFLAVPALVYLWILGKLFGVSVKTGRGIINDDGNITMTDDNE